MIFLHNCAKPHPNPKPIEGHQVEALRFVCQAHKILLDVFSQLDKHLALAPGTLAALCPLDKSSATALRLLLTRPATNPDTENTHRIAFAGHTDVGLITMLFNIVGGLQVLSA